MVENDDIFFLHFSIFAFFVLAIRFIVVSTRHKKEKKERCVCLCVCENSTEEIRYYIYFVSEGEER